MPKYTLPSPPGDPGVYREVLDQLVSVLGYPAAISTLAVAIEVAAETDAEVDPEERRWLREASHRLVRWAADLKRAAK